MASSRSYRKPRNQELLELLVMMPCPVKVCSQSGELLWQNLMAEQAGAEPTWISQPLKWQGRDAVLLVQAISSSSQAATAASIAELKLEAERLRDDNERLRRHQRSTARRKKKAETSVQTREKEVSALELREQRLRKKYETVELRVVELEEQLQQEQSGHQIFSAESFAKELEAAEQKKIELTEELAKARIDFAGLEQEFTLFREEARLERSKLQLQEQLATRILELESLEQSFREEQKASSVHNDELKLRLLEQEHQLIELRQKQQQQLASQGQEQGKLLEELRQDLEEAKSALIDSGLREVRLMDRLDSILLQKDEQTELLVRVRSEVEELREREKELQHSIDGYAEFEDELKRARTEALEARASAEVLQGSLVRLESELKLSQQELARQRLEHKVTPGISLRLPSTAGQEQASPTVKSQLDFAQSRLRDTEKQLDQVKEELKKVKLDAQSARETEKLAYQDALTGLPNRYMIHRYLDYSHSLNKTNNRAYLLFLIDLDGFRLINSTLGHSSGDKLLKAVGERLSGMSGSSHVAARDGQDRFLLLASDLDRSTLSQFAVEASRYLLELLAHPFEIKGQPLRLTASIGVAMGPVGENPAEIFTQVELALARVKHMGGGSFSVYDDALKEKRLREATYARQLGQAVARGEIYAVYQPVFDLTKGKIAGVEALLRWRHRDQRILQPSEFLALAIEEGMIFSIWQTVWPKAFRSLNRWCRQRPEMTMSINLSDRELLSPNLTEYALSLVGQCGLHPSKIMFEVRDDCALRLSNQWLRSLRELSEAGFGLILDDYGSQASIYSTLSYPGFRQAKMLVDERNPKCFPAADAAKGLLYCAKGVQTRFDSKGLRKAGFSLAQGFAVANPMEDLEIDGVLK